MMSVLTERQTKMIVEKELEIIGDKGSHNALRRILAKETPCKILDVPSGEGILTQFLKENNWDVYAADIDRGNFKIEKDRFQEVNLNSELPYEKESFDAVLCANGLHRLYNPAGAVSEFSRIIKPGGKLYINLNNYASFSKRLRFLFKGAIHNMITNTVCKQTIDNPEAHVRVPFLYCQLRRILESNGFSVEIIVPDVVKPVHRLLTPFALVFKLLGKLFLNKDEYQDSFNGGIFPGGSYFFLKAVKKEK